MRAELGIGAGLLIEDVAVSGRATGAVLPGIVRGSRFALVVIGCESRQRAWVERRRPAQSPIAPPRAARECSQASQGGSLLAITSTYPSVSGQSISPP